MIKLARFVRRVFRGEDVVLVSQTPDHWDRQFADGTWDRLQKGQPNTVEIARLICEHRDAKRTTMRVLDVGCGNGALALSLAGESSIDYTGIDISKSAIASAHAVAPHGTFIVGDAKNPLTSAGIYDVIVFNEFLYYIDPDTILPSYRTHADSDTMVCISVVRSWRSWFLWRRINRNLSIMMKRTIADSVNNNQFDVAVATFRL